MKTFSTLEALEFGWHKLRQHNGLLLKVMLSLFALQVVEEIVSRTIGDTLLGALASVALAVLSVVMSAGLTMLSLRIAEGHAAHYRDLFPWNRMVWLYFLASLLMGLTILGGLILLVIPGIFLMVRLSFVRFPVIEGAGPIEAIKRSWALTRGHWWHLAGFLLVLLGINVVGAILLLVGLLVSVPVSMLAMAHVYLKLKPRA
jgi:uncharacterized membrane protein